MSRTRTRWFGWKYVLLVALGVAALSAAGIALVRIPANVATSAAPSIALPEIATTTAAAVDSGPTLAAVKALVAGTGPLAISVLGDSTSNSTGEWVDLWAKDLTKHGTVTLHLWDEKTHDWKPAPVVYEGGERAITIWNGSQPGSTHLYAIQHLDKIQPEKPGFQIFNYGHNNTTLRADGGSSDLIQRIATKWGSDVPTVITLQNPASGARTASSASSVYYLRDWASIKGYPVIDANKAITDAGNLPALLLEDGLGVHPNPAGQRIWADTVTATLG